MRLKREQEKEGRRAGSIRPCHGITGWQGARRIKGREMMETGIEHWAGAPTERQRNGTNGDESSRV